MSGTQVADAIGCSERSFFRWLKRVPWKPKVRSPLRLSVPEREEILVGLRAGESMRSIARRLGRAPSTISREVAAQGPGCYWAWKADERAERLQSRPKLKKLETSPALHRVVSELLEQNWSPLQIAKRLRFDYPNDPSMRISHETIYQSLFVQGRGALRKELTAHLRRGRSKRQHRSKVKNEQRGKLRGMVNISQRPPEADDRAVPGHWEGDLVLGAHGLSAVGTLVERATRYVMLVHLPKGRTAECVREALTKKIKALPRELRRSLTWDQGRELAEHAEFTIETGVKVFFCDPHSPWQRGSNENTNGLLRQYFPKGVDLSQFSEAHLDKVARELNGRPRQTLNWRTPAEKLNELLEAA
jgi:IS30 family transposase